MQQCCVILKMFNIWDWKLHQLYQNLNQRNNIIIDLFSFRPIQYYCKS